MFSTDPYHLEWTHRYAHGEGQALPQAGHADAILLD
jgi:hypothetical protein